MRCTPSMAVMASIRRRRGGLLVLTTVPLTCPDLLTDLMTLSYRALEALRYG